MKTLFYKVTVSGTIGTILILAAALGARAADSVQRISPQRMMGAPQAAPVNQPTPILVSVSRADPGSLSIPAGSTRIVELTGTELEGITSASVGPPGLPANTVTAILGEGSSTSRPLILEAGIAAAPGRYTVRLAMDGGAVIALPEEILTVVVTGPASGIAAPSGLRVTGISAGSSEQTMDRLRLVSPPKAGTLASPALESGTGASLPPGEALAPRALEEKPPSGRVAVTPGEILARREAGTLTATQFNLAVSRVFDGARFDANACGGSYQDRKIVTSIPNTFFEEAVGAIGRLDYELTEGEQDQCVYAPPGASSWYKRKHIRACVENWNGRAWTGAVQRGRFLVRIAFDGSLQYVTTRALDRDWDWTSPEARQAIPDYWFNGLALEVLLAPRLEGDRISYGEVDARWAFVGGDTFNQTGRFFLEENRQRVLNYKDGAMESIRGKILSVFGDTAVRNRLSETLTDVVTANRYVNKVTALTGGGETITYDYE